jgi:hypothetical protein
MYGPPSDCKGKIEGGESLRPCIRPFGEEDLLAMMRYAAFATALSTTATGPYSIALYGCRAVLKSRTETDARKEDSVIFCTYILDKLQQELRPGF